jgi:hypothetical protein
MPYMHSNPSEPEEKRAEPRRQARGTVMLHPRTDAGAAIAGRLIDISRSGFRARHREQALLPGQEVEFEIAGLPGSARVIWTRIAGGRVESGFLILGGNGA